MRVKCDHAKDPSCPRPGCPHAQEHDDMEYCLSPFAMCKMLTGQYENVQCVEQVVESPMRQQARTDSHTREIMPPEKLAKQKFEAEHLLHPVCVWRAVGSGWLPSCHPTDVVVVPPGNTCPFCTNPVKEC